MRNDHFEWDDAKAANNWRDHAVTFDMACVAFSDAFAVEIIDDRQDTTEERYVLLGMIENRLLFVSYTMRGERIRIISARRAEPFERRK